jgi:hypothetical protein
LYDTKLREVDSTLIVKTISLRFSSTDRTGYYLFLTTRDANGALKMNDLLRKAEFREHFAIWADYLERTRQASELAGELTFDLGDTPQIPAAQPIERAMPDEVADRIVSRCGSGSFTIKQILAKMANDPFTETEVKSGITALKRQARASGGGRSVEDVLVIQG